MATLNNLKDAATSPDVAASAFIEAAALGYNIRDFADYTSADLIVDTATDLLTMTPRHRVVMRTKIRRVLRKAETLRESRLRDLHRQRFTRSLQDGTLTL